MQKQSDCAVCVVESCRKKTQEHLFCFLAAGGEWEWGAFIQFWSSLTGLKQMARVGVGGGGCVNRAMSSTPWCPCAALTLTSISAAAHVYLYLSKAWVTCIPAGGWGGVTCTGAVSFWVVRGRGGSERSAGVFCSSSKARTSTVILVLS